MADQYPLPLPHHEAMSVDDYVITASNRDAAQWVYAWPQWNSHCLIVLGPPGSGKTHLMHAWLQASEGKAISFDELVSHDAAALAARHAHLAIDDADLAMGQREAETNLFHLYNLVRETKGSLLLTVTVPPAQWENVLPDLRSRVLASPVAAIGVPDDELMSMLLVKQFHDRQIEVGEDVIAYLLPRIERTAGALRTFVDRLDRFALAQGRRITVALARRLLDG